MALESYRTIKTGNPSWGSSFKANYKYAHPDFRRDTEEFLDRLNKYMEEGGHVSTNVSEAYYLSSKLSNLNGYLRDWQGAMSPCSEYRVNIGRVAALLKKRCDLAAERGATLCQK